MFGTEHRMPRYCRYTRVYCTECPQSFLRAQRSDRWRREDEAREESKVQYTSNTLAADEPVTLFASEHFALTLCASGGPKWHSCKSRATGEGQLDSAATRTQTSESRPTRHRLWQWRCCTRRTCILRSSRARSRCRCTVTESAPAGNGRPSTIVAKSLIADRSPRRHPEHPQRCKE
jgi:hypothetical protein